MARAPMTEHTFTTWDREELFYRAWLPEKPARLQIRQVGITSRSRRMV